MMNIDNKSSRKNYYKNTKAALHLEMLPIIFYKKLDQ